MSTLRTVSRFLLLLLLSSRATLAGQDEPEKKLGWFDTAELIWISTGGNSEAETLGLRNTLSRVGEIGVLKLEAGALRADSTTTTRTAVGTPDSFSVHKDSDTILTAENYFLRGRYDRPLSEATFWFAGAGWERNEFAGLRNRTSAVGGVGNIWFDTEGSHCRTDYGLSFADQKDVVEDASTAGGFVGLRLGFDYLRRLTGSTSYRNLSLVDQNLDDTDDLRVDMTHSLSVSMSDRLVLRLSLQLLFDNQPGLVRVPLFTEAGSSTGSTVLGELDELDTILNLALVAHF